MFWWTLYLGNCLDRLRKAEGNRSVWTTSRSKFGPDITRIQIWCANTTLDYMIYGYGKMILKWILKIWVMMARTSIWGISLWWAVVNRLVITSGSTKGTDLSFFFCAGEFLMVSKEVLCCMHLVRIRLLLCADECIFGNGRFWLTPNPIPELVL
jgi:hypothetical protein